MQLLTTNELAERLNVHRLTIMRMVGDGTIPHIKISKKEFRYEYDEVILALKEGDSNDK